MYLVVACIYGFLYESVFYLFLFNLYTIDVPNTISQQLCYAYGLAMAAQSMQFEDFKLDRFWIISCDRLNSETELSRRNINAKLSPRIP